MIRIRDNKLTTIFITVIILFSMALSGCLFNNTSAYTYYLVDIGDTDEAMIKYGNQYSDYKFIWDDSGYLYGYNDNNKRVTSLGKVEYSESTQKSEITYKDKTILFNHGFESNAYYWKFAGETKEILTLPKPNRGVDNLEPTFCFDWEGDCLYLIDDTDILDVKIYSYEYDENQEVK